MKKLFQSSAVFYSSLVLVAILLQWWVAGSFESELRIADQEAQKPVKQIREHYDVAGGISADLISLGLKDLHDKILDRYKKLNEKILFAQSAEYRVDPKSAYPAIEFQERVKKFRIRNAKWLKELGARLNATLLSGNLIEPSADKVSSLLHQATILEELLSRLGAESLLPAIETLQLNPPREEQDSDVVKLVRKIVRYPILIEVSADPLTLDRFFKALLGGKQGFFFIEDMELFHGNDPESWGQPVRCRVSLSAVSLGLHEVIEAPPISPTWAAGIGR